MSSRPSTRKTTAGTASAGPSTSQPPSEIEPVEEEILEEEEEDEEPTAEVPTPEQWKRFYEDSRKQARLIKQLQTQIATGRDLGGADRLKVVSTSTFTAEEREERALKLLEKYPPFLMLVPFWPLPFREFIPNRDGAAQPITIEPQLENNRTYRRLSAEKKEAQRAEFVALVDVFVWIFTYVGALRADLEGAVGEEEFKARFAKYFNGLQDAIELAAQRISYIQIKTHEEEYGPGFSQVVASNQLKDKIAQQIASPIISDLFEVFAKYQQEKVVILAAKQAAQDKTAKPTTAQQTAGEKSHAKRSGRKRPEERPAPQA